MIWNLSLEKYLLTVFNHEKQFIPIEDIENSFKKVLFFSESCHRTKKQTPWMILMEKNETFYSWNFEKI